MRSVCRPLKFECLEPRNLLATLTVTTPLDVVDSSDPWLSLREAIVEANANNEDDVIQLAAETYTISIPGIYENDGLTGDFDILADARHRLEIVGHVDGTIIDAAQLDRAFDIHGRSDVSLSHLTIRNGSLLNEPEFTGRRGGAIKSTQSSLSLAKVEIRDSTAGYSGVGGGVWISGGRYSIEGSIIEGTSASIDGTALFARNSNGEITRKSGVFHTSVVNAPPGSLPYVVGAVTVKGGSLAIQGTKIDFNFPATGIKVVDGTLDAVHVRILHAVNGIHALDSQVTVTDSRISRMSSGDAIFASGDSDLMMTDIYFGANSRPSIHFEGKNLTASSILIDQTHRRNDGHAIDVSPGGNTNQQIQINQVEFLQVRTPVMVIDTPGSGANVVLNDISVSRSYRPWNSNSFRVMIDIAADHVAIDHLDAPLEVSNDLAVGVRIVADSISLDHSSIRDFERGLALDIEANEIDIRNSTISGNEGGIAVRSTGPGNVTRISNTTVSSGKPNRSGSRSELATALEWSPVDSQLIIDGSTFMNNESDGGLVVVKIGGENNDILVTGTRFEGNVAEFIGPIHVSGVGHQVTVANSVFVDNYGKRAGVFYVDASDSSLSIYSSTLVRNLTSRVPFDPGGGGVVRAASSHGLQLLVSNSILVGNGYNGSIEGSHIRNDNGTTTVRNSDIVDFNAGDGNILFGGEANGNTDAKPIFVNYRGNDFHLKEHSPLRDIGNLSDLVLDDFDLDGDSDTTEPLPDRDDLDRVFGAGLDLGAYESRFVV